MDWNTIWNSITTFFTNNGMKIIWAILILLIGFIVVKICLRIVRSWLRRTKMNPTVQGFINSIIKVVLYVILIMIILQVWGIPITTLATVLATAGVAISLALKDSLSNVAYGMILIATRPFDQGHYVKIGNVEGTVKSIEIMSTQIITTDNKIITIPNQIVYSNAMINYNATGKRRIDFYFDVPYETDVEKVRKIAMQVCHSNGKIMTDPAPELHVHEYKDGNIKLFLNCWTSFSYWEIYYYVLDNLHNELARNGIRLHFTQIEMRNHNDPIVMPFNKKPLPKRVEVVKEPENDDFNLFDIDSYTQIQHKFKSKKIRRLRKKKEKLDQELKAIESTMPSNQINILIKANSIMLKKKQRLTPIKIRPSLSLRYFSKKDIKNN